MKKWFTVASFIFLLLMTVAPVLASSGSTGCPDGAVCINNPLGSVTTPQALIGKVINGILGVTGSIALVMFIYGGITWMTSAGSSDKVAHGKETLVWATIGLVIIFSAYAMVRFVFSDILGGGSSTTTTTSGQNQNSFLS